MENRTEIGTRNVKAPRLAGKTVRLIGMGSLLLLFAATGCTHKGSDSIAKQRTAASDKGIRSAEAKDLPPEARAALDRAVQNLLYETKGNYYVKVVYSAEERSIEQWQEPIAREYSIVETKDHANSGYAVEVQPLKSRGWQETGWSKWSVMPTTSISCVVLMEKGQALGGSDRKHVPLSDHDKAELATHPDVLGERP